MSPSAALPSAPAVLGWLATYLVHSTLWFAGAWIVARWVREPAWLSRLWKGALVGGIASATLVVLAGTSRVGWSAGAPATAFGLLSADTGGMPITLELGGLPEVGTGPSPASATPFEPAADGAFAWLREVSAAQWLVAAWLLGAVAGMAHFLRLHLRLRAALAARRPADPPSLSARIDALRAAAGFERPVRLSVCRDLGSPLALLGDEIVIPGRALERLDEVQLDTLLAHELAHLARRDPWWLLAQGLIQRALFVQPLHRVAAARTREAAELCCDDLAAHWTRGELALARCLAEVASWVEGTPARGIAAGMVERASPLVERVERLLAPRGAPPPRAQGVLVGSYFAASLALFACVGPAVSGEQDQVAGDDTTVAELVDLPELGIVETSPHEDSAAGAAAQEPSTSAEEALLLQEMASELARQLLVEQAARDLDGDPAKALALEALEARREGDGSEPRQASRVPVDVEQRRAQLEARIEDYLAAQAAAETAPDGLNLQARIREDRRTQERSTTVELQRLQRALADTESAIHAKRARQAGMKPAHAQWQRLQRDIDALREESDLAAARISSLLQAANEAASPAPDALRIDQALAILEDCPEADIAFHVNAGGTKLLAVRAHALELRADGSIRCGDMELVAPGSGDQRLLLAHVAEIARVMEKAPSGRLLLPDGRLDLLIDPRAPHASLQRVLQACARREAMIWKMNLVDFEDEVRGPSVRFALPRDVGVSSDLISAPALVLVRPVPAAGGLPRRIEYEASYRPGPPSSEDGAAPREARTTTSLATLEDFLGEVHATDPRRALTIDARPGALYGDVVGVMDAAVGAGFTSITFVAERMPPAQR